MRDSEMVSGLLTCGENKVHCLRMGSGEKLLIAFHGFGNDAGMFKVLLPYLNNDYTIVSIDLPGHGKTDWKTKFFLPKDLMAVVQGIKQDFEAETFSLIGYSIGARIALNVVGLEPRWIEKVVLLAPDGLKKNIWYSLATKNFLGKKVFRQILKQPEKWLGKLAALHRLGLISESRYKFVSGKLADKKVNRQVGYVWPVLSRLIPVIPVVKYNIRKFKIDTHLFVGSQDRITPASNAQSFARRLKHTSLHLLDTGHHILTTAFLPQIAESLAGDSEK